MTRLITSYNQLKLIGFITSLIGFILSLPYAFFSNENIIYLFLFSIAGLAWTFSITLTAITMLLKKLRRDELSRKHELESLQIVYVVVLFMLTIGIFVFGLFKLITNFVPTYVELNMGMFVAISLLLNAVNDGWYLKLEREGLKDVDIED